MSRIDGHTHGDTMTQGGILCVFAHPDDEQFGTAAALLACIERGIRVDLLCATHGEGGEISDPALATPETLAAVREGELRTSCAMLGIQPPRLLDYPDGGLGEVDRAELVDRIVETMLEVRPRVVITFDANGGYGHPDHIAIHHATVDAVARAVNAGHRIDKLYATAYPRSIIEPMNDGMVALGMPPLNFGDVQTISADDFGTPDEQVTTVVPVAHLFERRIASLFAHRTQYGAEHYLARFPEELMRRLLAFDYFVRLHPAPPDGAWLPDENDLWTGLE